MKLDIFDKLSEESSRAYRGLRVYLDLGPERTLRKVAEELEIGENRIKIWSSKFNWRERADAWENYLAHASQLRAKQIIEKASEKNARRFADLKEEEFQAAQLLLKKAKEILELPVTKQTIEEVDEAGNPRVIIIEPMKVSPKDAGAILKIYSELSRLSLGVETSREKIEVEISTDMNKIQQAKEAYRNLREEMLRTTLLGLSLDEQRKLLLELPMVIAEQFKVNPKELIAGEPEKPEAVDGQIIEAEFIDKDLTESGALWNEPE